MFGKKKVFEAGKLLGIRHAWAQMTGNELESAPDSEHVMDAFLLSFRMAEAEKGRRALKLERENAGLKTDNACIRGEHDRLRKRNEELTGIISAVRTGLDGKKPTADLFTKASSFRDEMKPRVFCETPPPFPHPFWNIRRGDYVNPCQSYSGCPLDERPWCKVWAPEEKKP